VRQDRDSGSGEHERPDEVDRDDLVEHVGGDLVEWAEGHGAGAADNAVQAAVARPRLPDPARRHRPARQHAHPTGEPPQQSRRTTRRRRRSPRAARTPGPRARRAAARTPRSSSRAGITTDTRGPLFNGSTSSSDSRWRRSSAATSTHHAHGTTASSAMIRRTIGPYLQASNTAARRGWAVSMYARVKSC
jgi:hypothetical protein